MSPSPPFSKKFGVCTTVVSDGQMWLVDADQADASAQRLCGVLHAHT